ncbi:hypothetical protein B296_00029907 [Ensete ventricosum]|uniref:Uncharacterized protein n=1 Tax=Ensete ventricosum TaxID=4639 RepID=A0A426XNZ3_ENSVE|nr:hypothetical protein B296_00029907 [Ensete ventricosum]
MRRGSKNYQHHLFGSLGQQRLRRERVQFLRQLRMQKSPLELLRDRWIILDLRRVLQLFPPRLHLFVLVLMSQVGYVQGIVPCIILLDLCLVEIFHGPRAVEDWRRGLLGGLNGHLEPFNWCRRLLSLGVRPRPHFATARLVPPGQYLHFLVPPSKVIGLLSRRLGQSLGRRLRGFCRRGTLTYRAGATARAEGSFPPDTFSIPCRSSRSIWSAP